MTQTRRSRTKKTVDPHAPSEDWPITAPTNKQLDYIRSLAGERGVAGDPEQIIRALTRCQDPINPTSHDAAQAISALLAMPRTSAYCRQCRQHTNHEVMASDRQEIARYDDCDRKTVTGFDLYEMLKCRGCGAVQMRVTSKHSSAKPRIISYPRSIARRAPRWFEASVSDKFGLDILAVPDSVCRLMNEIYAASNNELWRLCAMGIRAVLENVMKEKVGDHKFVVMVDKFQEAGYLSLRQAEVLNSLLEAGHAAIHRDWEPTDEDISILLDITETVIETVYLHEMKAEALDRRVPKRPKPA
jgi:hypothetical protein